MNRLKRHDAVICTRIKKIDKDKLTVIAGENELRPSELVRACIECMLRNKRCVALKK